MDAIAVEKKIRDKFSDIVDTIVFCCGKKNEKVIRDKCSNLDFFIYEDKVLYANKINVIDRLEVAMEFAKDISLDLDISEEKRFQVEYLIAAIIIEAAKHENHEEIVKKALSKVEELDDNYSDEILRLVEYYKEDYQIKNMDEIIASSDIKVKLFEERLHSLKKEIIYKRFKVSDVNVDRVWDLLDAFTNDLEMLKSSEFKDIITGLQKEFYLELGCKGSSIEELTNDALDKGIIMSSYIRNELIKEYLEEYYNLYDAVMDNTNNLKSIMKKLDDKGYIYNKNYLRLGVTTPNITAINFLCYDKCYNKTSFIVFFNDELTYLKGFESRCFHEIIHYLGGINDNENKRGLKFNEMNVYHILEEAYVHYMSLLMEKEYNEKHGYIIRPWKEYESNSPYNKMLEYMEEVFKLYGKELISIHLSNDMTLKKANELIPFDQIAYAVSRIYNDENYMVVSKEEINKLIRSIRK